MKKSSKNIWKIRRNSKDRTRAAIKPKTYTLDEVLPKVVSISRNFSDLEGEKGPANINKLKNELGDAVLLYITNIMQSNVDYVNVDKSTVTTLDGRPVEGFAGFVSPGKELLKKYKDLLWDLVLDRIYRFERSRLRTKKVISQADLKKARKKYFQELRDCVSSYTQQKIEQPAEVIKTEDIHRAKKVDMLKAVRITTPKEAASKKTAPKKTAPKKTAPKRSRA